MKSPEANIQTNAKQLSAHLRDTALLCFLLTDANGYIFSSNNCFREKSRHTASQLSGISIIDWLQPEEAISCRQLIERCIANPGVVFPIPLHFSMANHKEVNFLWEVCAFADDDRKFDNLQWIGIDQGGKKTLHEEPAMNSFPERYKAYELSAGGLWKIDLKVPVLASLSPDEVITHCRKHAFLAECNDNLAKMYGYEKAEEFTGITINEMLNLEDPARLEAFKEFVKNGYQSTGQETKEFNRYGTAKYFINNMAGVVEHGMLTRIWGTQQDITDQRIAEQQLKKSELFYRNLFADSLDGMLLTDDKGMISFASPAITKILGYEPEETIDRSAFEFVHPDDRDLAISSFQEEVQMDAQQKFITIRLMKNTGEYVWCIVRGHNLLYNPYVAQMVVYFHDDTLRRQTEEALRESELEQRRLMQQLIDQEIQKQKLLTQATIDGQEKERLEIGKELHDNISQHLTMTRLYLEVVREKAPPEILEMVTNAHKNLSEIVNEIRRLSQSLVPPTLGDLGLIISVGDLCDTLRRTQGYQAEFHHRYFSEDELADNLKLMLFRIIQEQVNNIIRHAEATQVTIKLQADAEQLFLSVADNGKGFDANQDPRGLGLINIINRAGLFNGKVDIQTAPGEGCVLTVTVPL